MNANAIITSVFRSAAANQCGAQARHEIRRRRYTLTRMAGEDHTENCDT
jgi:hypothetical protein